MPTAEAIASAMTVVMAIRAATTKEVLEHNTLCSRTIATPAVLAGEGSHGTNALHLQCLPIKETARIEALYGVVGIPPDWLSHDGHLC